MSTATEFKSKATADAEARYEVADREHTVLMGRMLALDERHERAWTEWGKARILRRGQQLLTDYDAARHAYREAHKAVLLCRWHDACEVSRRAWAEVKEAQDSGQPAEDIAPLITAAEEAVDAIAAAAKAVERWYV